MDIIARAVSILMHDGLVVYPTETLYGLGADAFSDEAILKVYEAKKRPFGMPISIAVSDADMLACSLPRTARWMEPFICTFLPGPVTVVLPARKSDPGDPDRRDRPYRDPYALPPARARDHPSGLIHPSPRRVQTSRGKGTAYPR